jgi:hypothetical protein
MEREKGAAELLRRRLEMTDGLIEAYREEYWRVAALLAQAKEGPSLNDYREQGEQQGEWRTVLPHAVELLELSGGGQSVASNTSGSLGADVLRAEQSSLAALSREMKRSGALAVLLGVNNSYHVRSLAVTIGRRDADVDLTDELGECDRSVSRIQARIFVDDIGWRLLNTGKRPMSVDGVTLTEGEHAPLGPLSLISVATISVLFVPQF